ncbi:MAG TPA: S8 family serine peptidase [Novosphingobium sp.]|nr:S8 family serine peptidase [Novosphingobium sp.]
MLKPLPLLMILAAVGLAGAARGQVLLPQLGGAMDQARARAGALVDDVQSAADPSRLGEMAGSIEERLRALADARLDRLGAFVRAHRSQVEMDDTGQPARAREVLLLDAGTGAGTGAQALAKAQAAGYAVIEQGRIDGLDVPYARLTTPAGLPLAQAIRRLRALLPGADVSADQLHFPGGAASGPAAPRLSQTAGRGAGGTVGIIDGGTLPGPRIAAQAGFATGAPRANPHAQAIASLLAGAGTARICVADVYGADPAGGNALAIARALGWMAGQGAHVVSISLVGPANPLLARALVAAQARGMIVVAAVGNDGAAAPPAYPASYAGVVAVTGVDGRRRPLFEAGRATHLDYAAPGADMVAAGLDGRLRPVRGTSFAAPLAAARIAAAWRSPADRAQALARADAEALAQGPRTGRGILCDACRKGMWP